MLETTFHSWAIWSLLSGHGARIIVANSMQVKAIAHARIKTDKIDAHILAQALRHPSAARVLAIDGAKCSQRWDTAFRSWDALLGVCTDCRLPTSTYATRFLARSLPALPRRYRPQPRKGLRVFSSSLRLREYVFPELHAAAYA